ncbi:MAG: RagB/SusD family nutrient uptake outer membrane protein [Muribaculaceae bacterium]|nr:RagB/SusD family nutrient uptake outer membrane protein [Muribaculaceae bacterium]
MKLKSYIYAVPLLLAATGLGSCDSIFRDAPIDSLPENVIWGNPQLLDEYVLPWYRNMDDGFYTFVTTIMPGLGSEYEPWYSDQLTVGKSDWYSGDYGNILKSSQKDIITRARTEWFKFYTQLNSINTLLENQESLVPYMKDRVLGEAHFFRAWYYYKMLRLYGGTMIIPRTYDPLVDPVRFPRASYEEMVKFICDEAELASTLLPYENGSSDVGRPTKGVCYMLKAKTYFWVAGEHFQNQEKDYLGFPDDRSMDMLDLAAAEYDRVIATGVYGLVHISGTNKEDVVAEYRNIFLTKNSRESIWEVQHVDDGDFSYANGHKLDRDASAPSFGGTVAAYNPTQNHVDEYRMENGKKISDPTSGYDKNNPYEGRDWRFYANILYDGSEWRGHTMDIHYETVDGKEVAGEDLTKYDSSTTSAVTRTGYYMAKFLNEKQAIDNDQTKASSQNCILWRYAELLLDYAEIDFKKGRTGDALDKVNQIRRRVKMPELTSIAWDDIFNERRVELAFEKTVYWDLLRWNIAEKYMTGTTNPLYGVKIVYKADGSKNITNPVVNGRNTVVRYFRSRQYYYPLDWDDIRYHGLEQNPEWIEM